MVAGSLQPLRVLFGPMARTRTLDGQLATENPLFNMLFIPIPSEKKGFRG